MTKDELHKILELGEGQYIEFKESIDKGLQKEMVAFANASGGFIYIGISDNSEIKGINLSNTLKSQIQDTARNCDPPLIISLQEIDNIIEIEVKEGVNKPYSCSAGFFMRMGANSQKMKRDEILALAIKTGKIRYDEQICENFDWKDFDDDKFEYYLKLAGISNNLPREDILRNLRVLTNEGFTNAGALYFAKEPYKYIISSKIRCIHFNDNERVDILDKKLIDKGIIGNIEYAVAYLKERIPVRYEINDLKRKEFPEYPIEAYREAIVNAIIHFDYFLGDTIAIEKLKSSIVINNKGELLFPKSEFGKKSEARNRLLVDLLARTSFMEKAGTGIKRVSNACAVNGNKLKFDFSDSFWITIYSNEKSNNVTDNVTDDVTDNVTDDVTDDVTDREQIIFDKIKQDNKVTTTQLANQLNVSKRTILRDIEKLKQQNKIKRIGDERTGYWEIL
jgi:ATP-dependent DNA helicase RecG